MPRPEGSRELVTTVAAERGWQERRSAVETGALWFGLGTLALLVVGGLVAVLVLALA